MKAAAKEELIDTLQHRFEKNPRRHQGIDWQALQARLEANPRKLEALQGMERTGGEPDVIGYDKKARRYGQVFVYHNGAESYYSARGFRGVVSV